jgi:hypothetical protein
VEKYGRVRQATDDNIIKHRDDLICMPDNEGKIQTPTHNN